MVSFRHRRGVDPELQLFLEEMAARQNAAIETSSPRHRYFERRRRLRRQLAVDEPDDIVLEPVQFSPYKQPLPSVRYAGLYATSTPKSRHKKILRAPVFEQMYPPMEINPAAARLIEARRRYRRQRETPPRIIISVDERRPRLAGYRRPMVISSPVRRMHRILSEGGMAEFLIRE